MTVEKIKLCPWCSGKNRKGEIITDITFHVEDDDFGKHVKPNMLKYCPFCGRKLWGEDK